MINFIQCIVFALILSIQNAASDFTTSFPIGGLFNRRTLATSLQAYRKIIEKGGSLTYHGRYLDSAVEDSYSTSLELCSFTSGNRGIVALIDARPTNGICDSVCLLCNRLNISHLSLGWQPPATLDEDLYTFSYHPPYDLISKAYVALIKKMNWDKFTILYEDESSFVRLQEVINSWPTTMEPILYRKLDPDGDNREIFKFILKVERMSYHILDCKVKNVQKYMKEIIQVENSTEYLSFILTNLDAYTQNFEDIPTLMANVSTMHLTLPFIERWKDKGMDPDREIIQLETALTADALNHIEIAIRSIDEQPYQTYLPPLCVENSRSDYRPWTFGHKLREALIKTSVHGFTGNVTFDEQGRRSNFVLQHSKLDENSRFINYGHWDSQTNIIKTIKDLKDKGLSSKDKKILRVVTRKGEPYLFTNGTSFRGYAVDLVDMIFKTIREKMNLNYTYEIYRVAGDKYGNPIAGTKKWDGLIGELLEHKADLAVCDLTITSERNAVVDFSVPFMTLGISTLFKEPDPVIPDKFSFMKPLSLDVWLYLATTYVLVSFVLLICARMCQEDWVNPHPCNQNPENLQNIWSLYNCMWLTMGAIMTQGCDILPRAPGSRWVAGMWWFFALIMTASYTANMSAFLKTNRRSDDIKDVKDLADQTQISYGAVYNGSTYKFFEKSNDSLYSKIWDVMNSAKPTVFTADNEEGMNRVLSSKSNYAFFMESTAIEYYTKKHCKLKMVGSTLDSKEYGIAMAKYSPYKRAVDLAILLLQEAGDLDALKSTWWEEDRVLGCEEEEKEDDDSGSLQMKNTSGIFLVLGIGGVLGVIVAIIDFMLYARQVSVKEKVTFWDALSSEWRASLNPRELHKLVAPPRSAPPSTATPSPQRERSQSRAVSVLRAATSFINFDEIY